MADYLLGLDLGKMNDFTALSIVRRSMLVENGRPKRDHRERVLFSYAVVHAKRYLRGTPYTTIVDDLRTIVVRPEIAPRPRLIIDATGVGNGVVDLVLAARLGIECIPLTITGGESVRHAPWPGGRVRAWWVAKHQLCSAVLAALESGRLKISDIPHEPGALDPGRLLREELKGFRVKVTKSANETYQSREGEHDDLVLSVAMPVCLGGQRLVPYDPESQAPAEAALLDAERVADEKAERAARENEDEDRRKQEEREYRDPSNPIWWQ